MRPEVHTPVSILPFLGYDAVRMCMNISDGPAATMLKIDN